MSKIRTQITGLGPVNPDGSRQIFDKEPKPFIATADWLRIQTFEPEIGDYLDIDVDGSVTLVKEASVSNAAAASAAHNPDLAKEPDAQKKTDGGEGSGDGLNPYAQRVLNEKKELDEKLGKLSDFLDSPKSVELEAEVIGLLRDQERAMTDYSNILGLRIHKFKAE